MAEPSTEVFHKETILNLLWTYLAATRPAFLTASVLPVIAALALAWSRAGGLDLKLALVIIVTIVLVHSSANVLNDVFDARNGTDRRNRNHIYPFTGGSRFIQQGVLTERQMLRFGLALLGAGMLLGIIGVLHSGPWLLPIGVVGILLAYFYSAPPCLACHGLGDLAIAICFGVLPVVGTVYSLNGVLDGFAFWAGLSIGCFVAAILWINSIPDIEADRLAGKHTWPSRLGPGKAAWLLGLWFLSGFGLMLFSPLAESVRFGLFALLPAFSAFILAVKARLDVAIPLTIVTHVSVALLLMVDFLRL